MAIPLQDPALFTDTPHYQAYIRNDPLALRKVTIAFARANQKLNQYATEAPGEIRVPLLLVLAGRDRIVNNDRTRAFFEQLGSPDKQLTEFAEAGHTLEFEPDPAPYFADLTRWAGRYAR